MTALAVAVSARVHPINRRLRRLAVSVRHGPDANEYRDTLPVLPSDLTE